MQIFFNKLGLGQEDRPIVLRQMIPTDIFEAWKRV